MTHSGRCYAPINSRIREGESSTKNKGIKIAAPKKKDKESINEPITELKANEFINFIKHSVITVFCSTWMTTKIQMESLPIFSVRV